ncbi:MAG: hypothetical protein ABJA82_05360 [Myxococcales bacterium]
MLFPSNGESEPGIECYYFEVPIGAAGAVGAIVRQRGLANPIGVVRTGAGVFVFTLLDGVNTIVDWSFDIITTTPTAGGAWPRVTARTQTSITLTVMNAAGAAATDPNNGDTIIGSIVVKNTNA